MNKQKANELLNYFGNMLLDKEQLKNVLETHNITQQEWEEGVNND